MAYEGGSTVYPSKRDGWLGALLWVTVLGMVFAAISFWQEPASLGVRLGFALLMGASGAFVVWVLYSTSYRLSGGQLLIRSGPFRWSVPLDSIEEIQPTRNILSSPACSLDRLRIRYRGSRYGVMISPESKSAFLQDIASRSPGLRVTGDRAVREST
jgi:hypothetical protein